MPVAKQQAASREEYTVRYAAPVQLTSSNVFKYKSLYFLSYFWLSMLCQSCADNLKRMWFQTQDSADEGLTFQ
jgi:hypothetical protein